MSFQRTVRIRTLEIYRALNEFRMGYQSRSNFVKDENCVLLADSHNILSRWKNYFPQLLNVHGISDVRQIEIYSAEPLVPDPSPCEVELAIAKLKCCTSPGSDQIPAEMIQVGGEILRSKIHKLINYIWNKEESPVSGRSLLLHQCTRMAIKLTVVIIVRYHCYQRHTKLYPISFSQG
jgi:hypothetical protein